MTFSPPPFSSFGTPSRENEAPAEVPTPPLLASLAGNLERLLEQGATVHMRLVELAKRVGCLSTDPPRKLESVEPCEGSESALDRLFALAQFLEQMAEMQMEVLLGLERL